jgi:hypothetical protein
MKSCSCCNIDKELTEFHKDSGKKDGVSYICKTCAKQRTKDWAKNNRAKAMLTWRNWQIKNKEKHAIFVKNWATKNPGKRNAITAKRRASKAKRTPAWLTELDWTEIKQFYKDAEYLTQYTGTKIEVDHIVPLQGKNVSGLHVPSNLQLLVRTDNRKKSNKDINYGDYNF